MAHCGERLAFYATGSARDREAKDGAGCAACNTGAPVFIAPPPCTPGTPESTH